MEHEGTTYEKLERLKPAQSKRLTGVKRETFKVMVSILRAAEKAKPNEVAPRVI